MKKKELDSGLKSFRLLKYFSFSSIGVILVFTLVLSWIISDHTRKVMLEQSEEYSLLLAENLNQQVFRRFVIEAVIRYGGIALSNAEQFEQLDKIIRGIIHGLKIDSVTIYDSKKNIISYSTVAELVGKEDLGGVSYLKALDGQSNSKFIYPGRLQSLIPGRNEMGCKLKTCIPFRQVKADGKSGDIIMGVIEITQDLSSEYGAIVALQRNIIMVSAAVMTMLFMVLTVIVSIAGKKMEEKALERLNLEEKLNQSKRLAHLGTMVATVSHEIKSPLGIVRSTAEILGKRLGRISPENTHLSDIIVNETKRLNNIVVEFLDFARPQEAKFTRGDVNEMVNKALVFISSQAKERKIEVSAELCPRLQPINLDKEQFYRALLNILINALQAVNEGGKIRVVTEMDGLGVKIMVSDSGVGMAEEKLEKIFTPFYTDKSKGTGLGLAITKNIIDLHHGEITVVSRENEGTTFTINLPR
ncbi:MAG: two-component sensor histidine kinase [Deltaproteobacteria bacterium]|nr:MAG: two-component sensor histidine kinase [Deltaproteobacteria bacterium]